MSRLKYFPLVFSLAAALLSGCASRTSGDGSGTVEEVEEVPVQEHYLGFDPEGYAVQEGSVRNGDFFTGLMTRLGLSAQEAYRLAEACDTLFDVRKLRAGNRYEAYYGPQGHLDYVVYEKDKIHSVVFQCCDSCRVSHVEKPVTTVARYADATIESSLWNDMIAADASPLLILNLSDIYAWTVDFFGLQKGDRFRVFYDEKRVDDEVVAVDTVRYAVFTHAGVDYPAVMFDQGDGGNIYWNDKGESMRKAFLKAPLHYSRISSGFSYARRHPITRKVQPHTGVDYAAPYGTPVVTIGDGVVTSCRNEGAGGNTIRIRHNSVYRTAYLHLSKFASGLKPGKRVKQGEVIGYVGSTGRSTGPHLDFRIWKNDSPVNPLKMQSPPAEPLRQENMEAFRKVLQEYGDRMAGK